VDFQTPVFFWLDHYGKGVFLKFRWRGRKQVSLTGLPKLGVAGGEALS